MRAILFGFLLVTFGGQQPAPADDTLVITKSGYYLLKQDAAGIPTLHKIERIIRLDEPPDDPVPDPTDPPAVFRAAVTKATAAVNDPNKANAKTALAKLYRTTASLPVETAAQLREATNVIYNALKPPGGNLNAAWDQWKTATDAASKSFAGEDADKTKQAWQIIAESLEAAARE